MVNRSRSIAALSLIALLAVAASATPSVAAPLSGTLATDASGPIAAYSNTAAWNRWDGAASVYRIVVDRGGTIRTLDVPPSARTFSLSAGRGPDGVTWLVWSRCAGDPMTAPTNCDVEGYDLGTHEAKSFPFAARAGVLERAPALDGNRLIYVTGGDAAIGRVHLSALDGSGDHVIDVMPSSTCELSEYQECVATARAAALSSAVRGQRVAVTSRVGTTDGPFDSGICGLATVRLLDLTTSAVRTLDDSLCGLSGQGLTDVTFDADGRLWWRQSCGGDPSACEGAGGGPFRQTAAGPQRLVNDLRSGLDGSAVATRTPILLARGPQTSTSCGAGANMSSFGCGTVTAGTATSFQEVRAPREKLPPPGYVTVDGTSRVRVLRPPAKLACSRGDTHPTAGATLWAGASWLRSGERRTHGPAVPVTATSGRRTVKGTVPTGAANHEGQITTKLDLGGTSKGCARTWTLTYRPPGGKAIRFTTRVLPR